MKVYLTSTLKNEWNRTFNPLLCKELEVRGITCHLPQRDTNQKGSGEEKCISNLAAIRDVDVVIGVAENETVNWGLEIGYAASLGKRIVLLTRTGHDIPVMSITMVHQCVTAHNLDDISSYIDELAAAVRTQ